jgi:peptide/nickel transport system permease protein
MITYIIRRLFYIVIMFWLLSVVSFTVIQLPPGNFLSSQIMRMEAEGSAVSDAQIASLKSYYGLDEPLLEQYRLWFWHFLHGDLGRSFQYDKPVTEMLSQRLPYSMALSLTSLVLVYLVAIPIGVYSATHQYNLLDYVFTLIGFVGMATPNFMLALILMYFFFKNFGISVGGLFSSEYVFAPWTIAKFANLLQHMIIPVIVIGTAGTAGLIRVMRSQMLDELGKQYVITARAKGLPENRLLVKYPVRVALNPIISTIGWQLPRLVSGETIVSVVLSLPKVGPLLLSALKSQDMYMAGSILMILTVLTLIGTLISDILLVIVDPRITFEGKA